MQPGTLHERQGQPGRDSAEASPPCWAMLPSRPRHQRAAVRQVPLDLLEPNPFQPRSTIDPAALDELAQSIRLRGILQPLLVRPHPTDRGRFQIIAGERRWRAAGAAGLHEVPALVREMADTDAAAVALVENLQRQDLNAIDEAEGYDRLHHPVRPDPGGARPGHRQVPQPRRATRCGC